MKRKRFIKLLMSIGVSRNEATVYADACGPDMPHNMMGFLVETQPSLRSIVRSALTDIMQGNASIEILDAERRGPCRI